MLLLQEITNGLNAQQYPKLSPTNTIENLNVFAIVKSANSKPMTVSNNFALVPQQKIS